MNLNLFLYTYASRSDTNLKQKSINPNIVECEDIAKTTLNEFIHSGYLATKFKTIFLFLQKCLSMAEGRFTNPVVASLAGIKDFFAKQKLSDRLKDSDRADGKTCLVTGANSGLGFALAVELAIRGAHVIMAGRSKIPEAGDRVKQLSGSENVEMRYLDLSDVDSIHQFIDGLKRDDITLDICILNAATALPKARQTRSGQDEMFLVNYLSNVMLTHLMLVDGILCNRKKTNGTIPRLLFISSDSHQGATYIDYDEFGRFFDYGVSKAISNYSYFKLVLNTFALELSRRINRDQLKVSVLTICPGPVHSNIVKKAPWLLRMVLRGIFKIIFKSPAKAALPVIYMALSDDFEGKTGEYLHMFNPKEMDPKVYEPEEGMKLWERSQDIWRLIDPQCRTFKT